MISCRFVVKPIILISFILTVIAGLPSVSEGDSSSEKTPQTTKEFLKKQAADAATEKTSDYIQGKVQEKVEKKAPQLIDMAYRKYPVIARFTGSKDFSELMKDYGKYSDAYGNLTTVNSILVKVAEGNTLGAGYDATKEIFTKLFPPAKYIFSYLEAWDKILTSVSDAVTENNLEYIRKQYMLEVLPKCKEFCPLDVEQNFARRVGGLMSEDEQGAYGLVAWYCKEGGAAGSVKCGSICVSGPFDWSKRRSFGNSGCEAYAVMSFIRNDEKIRKAIAAHNLLLKAIEDVGDMQKALKNASDYVKKNLLLYEQEQEKIIAAQEKLQQEERESKKATVAMEKGPDKCDESCARQINAAHEQYNAIGQEIGKRRLEINKQEQTLRNEMGARSRELGNFYLPSEIQTEPGDVAIDEDNVDFNGSQAERLEKIIANAEKWLQLQPMQIGIYDTRISGLQSLAGLYGQSLSLYARYGNGWRRYGKPAEKTVNAPLMLETEIKGWELKKQTLQNEISLVQTNLAQYKALESKYRNAFEQGSKKARELLEKEIEPAFKEYEEADRELENIESERRAYEQEKLVQINGVMARIRDAKNQAEVDAILPQVNKDMAEYGKLLQKQSQLAQKAEDKRQKVEAVSRSSRIRRAKSTLGYAGKSMSSRMVRSDLSGSKFSLSDYLPYIAQANLYVVTESTRRYDETLKKIPDETTFIIMPESDVKKLSGEVFSATGDGAVLSIKNQAANIAKIKDFNGAYRAYQSEIKSHTYNEWKIDYLLTEEARTALEKLASFRSVHFTPLVQKRSDKIGEKITYSQPKIGKGAQELHGAVRLTDQDIANGAVPFQIKAEGWGIARAVVRVAVEGKNLPLNIETSTAKDKPAAVYTAMIPVKDKTDVHVSYTIGNWTYALVLHPPADAVASQEQIRKIKDFYQKFQEAYEGRSDAQIMAMLRDDWQAGDGTTLSDLRSNLRRTFKMFDEIRYKIKNMAITPLQNGHYRVSYDVTITSRIYKRNLKHEEKSSIQEEVAIDKSGKPKVFSTLGGRFWYVR